MARDGSGNYVLPASAVAPAVSGTAINSTAFNALMNDIATALTGSMTRDGQGVPAVDISFNSKKITNLANGVGSQDATSLSQVQALISADRKSTNRVVNGSMVVDQRNEGATQTFTAGAALAYTVDQWYGFCTGANVTGAQVAGSGRNQFRYRFTGAASVTGIGFGTRIEQNDCYDLEGQTVTLSVDLANSALGTVNWAVYRANSANAFGTVASPTRTSEASGTFTVTGTVTTFTNTFALSAFATTGLEIVFTVGAQTSGTWTIGNVQLELGSAASAFERRAYADELLRCQRFYRKTFPPGTAPASNTGVTGALSAIAQVLNQTYGVQQTFSPPMFATPTIGNYNPLAANNQWSGAGVVPTNVGIAASGYFAQAVAPTIAAGTRSNIHQTAEAVIP